MARPDQSDQAVHHRGSETLYQSPRFRFEMEHFDTPDGPVSRPAVHHPGAVAIVARPTPESVLMVRQYRYPLRTWTYEIPAGTCEPGEDLLLTAQRELQEEAGYRARDWRRWFSFYPSLGLTDELLTVFLADGLEPCQTAPDQGELVAPVICSHDEIRAQIAAGRANDAKTLLALARLPGLADCYALAPEGDGPCS